MVPLDTFYLGNIDYLTRHPMIAVIPYKIQYKNADFALPSFPHQSPVRKSKRSPTKHRHEDAVFKGRCKTAKSVEYCSTASGRRSEEQAPPWMTASERLTWEEEQNSHHLIVLRERTMTPLLRVCRHPSSTILSQVTVARVQMSTVTIFVARAPNNVEYTLYIKYI